MRDIYEIRNDDLKILLDSLGTVSTLKNRIHVIHVALDADGFKFKINHGTWSQGLGEKVD